MKLLRKEFLPEGWEDEHHTQICNSRLKSSDSFTSWLNDVCHINFALRGSDHHFNDDTLRIQLESLLDTDLRTRAKNRNVKDLVEAAVDDEGNKMPEARLACWKNELRKLADERAQDTKRYLEAAEELHRPQKRQALGQHSRAFNTAPTSSTKSTTSSAASTSSTRTKTPALTQNERALLNKHQGCTKCRRGYQDHRAFNCPNDFPDLRNYKELMDSILLSHKHGQNASTNSKAVAAVTSASIADTSTDSLDSPMIGAVMPSCIIGNGSESEAEVSAPFTVQHLRWQCSLIGLSADEPVC
jgi:hypothetical protein